LPSHFFPVVLTATTLVATHFQAAQALDNTEIGAIAEAITVRIEGQNPGSGVLIKQAGNTYTILTAAHVVETEDEYEIETADGVRYPVNYQLVQKLTGVDLALVEFSSNKPYKVANLGNSSTVQNGAPVYVSGFPEPTAAITKQIFTFSLGNVTANANQPLADGYALVYRNNTLPGMSGGAVLDQNGKLVGIHGRADTVKEEQLTENIRLKTGFNLAIPINTFTTLIANTDPSLGFTSPTSPVVASQQSTADDLFLRAGEKEQNGDLRGAIADYTQAIQLKPDFADAYKNRGDVRSELGDKPGAIADYNKAISLNPNDAGFYNNRALVKSDLGDKPGELADYDQAIQLDPTLALAYYNRGNALIEVEDKDRAIADYTKAIDINPNDAAYYYNRGITLAAIGDKQGGIDDFSQAIKLEPDFAEAYGNRGIAYYEIGDYRNAILSLQTAANLFQQQGKPEEHDKAIGIIQQLFP
jgi:tetratricopeptide (TPR) repeat protein